MSDQMFEMLAVVLAFVELIKETFNLEGKAVRLLSMVVGMGVNLAYSLTVALPATPADWFAVVFGGLTYGLIAAGLYKVGKQLGETPAPALKR